MTETLTPEPTLSDYIKALGKVEYNGVPITMMHSMRGILDIPVEDRNGEAYDLGQGKKEEVDLWKNVAEHGAVGIIIADVLGESFGLSSEERGRVNLAVWLQDSGKRTERMWQELLGGGSDNFRSAIQDENENESWDSRQQRMLHDHAVMEEWENAEVGLSNPRIHELMRADIPRSDTGHGKDLAAKISWFTDAILTGPNIVGIKKRFDDLVLDPEKAELNTVFSASFKDRYNGQSLYTVQRKIGAQYETEFSQRLGIDREQLYPWLQNKVQDRIRTQRMPIMPPAPSAVK